ncbi:MAG: hypothetical protein KA715_05355 [Xanthomonadaceae bacterium]|nr:hypothetical protein [Xanthomonadaceae bacterium]
MKKKLIKHLIIAATLGIILGISIYFTLPKEYETSGILEIGRVDRKQVFSWSDVNRVLDETESRSPGVSARYFRTDTFQYTVKFRSNNYSLLLNAPQKMMEALNQKFRTQYDSLVNPKLKELEELKLIRTKLDNYLKTTNIKQSMNLADTYYLYQIHQMIADAHLKELNVIMYLNEDATRFFSYSKSVTSNEQPVFPNLATCIILSIALVSLITLAIYKLKSKKL